MQGIFMDAVKERVRGKVLGVHIDVGVFSELADRLISWARIRESRYVTICNAHVVVSATQDPSYAQVIEGADMATADGAPVAWMLRRIGFEGQERVSGPDLMWMLCQRCAEKGVGVYLYGGTEATVSLLQQKLTASFPALRILSESPPFRALSSQEDEDAVSRINTSAVGFVFVGLGCPKQERWMAAHRGRIQAVMVGVGAAFDFHAGTSKRAPKWMRQAGLEWLHRLCSEPRRLWRRYLVTNSLFVLGALRQLASRNSPSIHS
jgi:N-acetylglucosaminyldiphosphoundecaprenol N-acetyl-beta-D-mannosaminyltransferase